MPQMPEAPLAGERVDEDRYFDLGGLAAYSGLSARTLRRLMADPVNPLPNHHVHGVGVPGGKVLVSKREFDEWVRRFPPLERPRRARADPHDGSWVRRLGVE